MTAPHCVADYTSATHSLSVRCSIYRRCMSLPSWCDGDSSVGQVCDCEGKGAQLQQQQLALTAGCRRRSSSSRAAQAPFSHSPGSPATVLSPSLLPTLHSNTAVQQQHTHLCLSTVRCTDPQAHCAADSGHAAAETAHSAVAASLNSVTQISLTRCTSPTHSYRCSSSSTHHCYIILRYNDLVAKQQSALNN